MIKISRLNGSELYINDDLIEFIEATPDTVISMTTGKKIIASDSVEEILEKITAYKKQLRNNN